MALYSQRPGDDVYLFGIDESQSKRKCSAFYQDSK